jgi:hypothetical protein
MRKNAVFVAAATRTTHCRAHAVAVQRIENWWNYIWSKFAWYWRQVFLSLEERGVLDSCV